MSISFHQAVAFLIEHGIVNEFYDRVVAIKEATVRQNWSNHYDFTAVTERLEY